MADKTGSDAKIASLRGKIAANTRVSKPDYDGRAATKPATDAYWEALEKQVDPDGALSPQERHRKAVAAWRARMAKGQLKAAKTRARNRGRTKREEREEREEKEPC